jgi:hypothetical protein
MDLFAPPIEPSAQPAMPTAALGELGQLRKLYSANARPLQLLNGRVIRASAE